MSATVCHECPVCGEEYACDSDARVCDFERVFVCRGCEAEEARAEEDEAAIRYRAGYEYAAGYPD